MRKPEPEKPPVPPALIAVAAVFLVLFLSFLGWKFFAGSNDSVDTATVKARIAAKEAKNK